MKRFIKLVKEPTDWITVVFLVFISGLPIMTLCGVNGTKEPAVVAEAVLEGNGTAEDASQDKTTVQDKEEEEKSLFTKMQDGLKVFTENLFLRDVMISMNTDLTERLTGGTYMESTQVLLGKDNWLFYKTQNDGQPLYDYMGINRYTDSELEELAEEMVAVNEYVEKEQNVSFVVALIPNKEIIYEEYMPDTVARVETESRGEQVAKYMQENTDVTFVYPKAEMLQHKDDYQLYYNTDTHWNQIGAFVGLQAIFKAEYGTYASPDTVKFNKGKSDFAGDLATIAGETEKFAIDQMYNLNKKTIDPKQYRDEVVLIAGDSFAGFLTKHAKKYYKEVYRVTIDEFTPQMLKEYDVDIFIWESVERYVRFPNRRRCGLTE